MMAYMPSKSTLYRGYAIAPAGPSTSSGGWAVSTARTGRLVTIQPTPRAAREWVDRAIVRLTALLDRLERERSPLPKADGD